MIPSWLCTHRWGEAFRRRVEYEEAGRRRRKTLVVHQCFWCRTLEEVAS